MHHANESKEALGVLTVPLRGKQYCDALLLGGEPAYLIREPENTYDRHAIRVENSGEAKAGYLPRRVSSWLAPLMDSGRVFATGRGSGTDARATAPGLDLCLRLTELGEGILRACPPENPLEALHQVVLQGYLMARSWHSQELLVKTSERLQALAKERLLPETRMLLALMPGLAEQLYRRRAEAAADGVRSWLAQVRLEAPLHHHNLTVFPLSTPGSEADPAYLLLGEALESGLAEVTEVSAHGSVPELRLRNMGDLPLLLPEGELLEGAKQNRVVNVTLLAPAHSELLVPVSCVEQGRWHSVSEKFSSRHFAPPRLRGRKLESVPVDSAGRSSHSDQGRVWDDVAECLHAADAESDTDSLTEAFTRTRESRRSYEEALLLPAQAAGALVMSGAKVLGMDLFDCAKTFRSVWPRVSEGYYFEASRDSRPRSESKAEAAAQFLQTVSLRLSVVESTPGRGLALRVSDGHLSGAGVWYEDRLCHLAAFSLD